MSFYRSLLAASAALALTLPAFADETTTTTTTGTTDQGAAQVTQTTEAKDAPATQTTQTTQTTTTETKIDLNKATVKELTQVKGITPAKAKAIVSYRKKNGEFKTTEDLKNVKGFQKLTAEQLKEIQDQLTAG